MRVKKSWGGGEGGRRPTGLPASTTCRRENSLVRHFWGGGVNRHGGKGGERSQHQTRRRGRGQVTEWKIKALPTTQNYDPGKGGRNALMSSYAVNHGIRLLKFPSVGVTSIGGGKGEYCSR